MGTLLLSSLDKLSTYHAVYSPCKGSIKITDPKLDFSSKQTGISIKLIH